MTGPMALGKDVHGDDPEIVRPQSACGSDKIHLTDRQIRCTHQAGDEHP